MMMPAAMALASRSAPARRLLSCCSSSSSSSTSLSNIGILSWRRPTMRQFHGTSAHQTDGASIDLTDRALGPLLADLEALIPRPPDKAEALRSSQKLEERDMSPKKSSDSYHRVVLPLGRDLSLRKTYINSLGGLKLGTIVNDLDDLSGVIVSKHAGPGITPVTVGFGHIEIPHAQAGICDLVYSGQVTSTSGHCCTVAVTCKVARARDDGEQPSDRPGDVLLTCTFTVQAFDTETRRPVNVPRLVDEMPEEERSLRAGEAMALLTKKTPKKSPLSETEPEDPGLIHKVWMRKIAQSPYRRSHTENESKIRLNEPFEEIPLHEPDERVPVTYLKTTRPRKVELVHFRTDEVVDEFVSQSECAKFLAISETAVRKRLKNNTVFMYKNSLLYLR
ncbi:hypothetical protein GGR55DRAFT_638765 [Xylaria sp. FL0064]|nr:hypothetical protein GGR55DRAFT_638765 [Xylaria sp. FL0064]